MCLCSCHVVVVASCRCRFVLLLSSCVSVCLVMSLSSRHVVVVASCRCCDECLCCRHVCRLCFVMSSWCCRLVAVVAATSAATNARHSCAWHNEMGPRYCVRRFSISKNSGTWCIAESGASRQVQYCGVALTTLTLHHYSADHVKTLWIGFHHVDMTLIVCFV